MIEDTGDFGSPQWQPIETAPKDRTQILAVTNDGRIMIWSAEMLRRIMSGNQPFHLQFPATHWMPLPKPPCGTGMLGNLCPRGGGIKT